MKKLVSLLISGVLCFSLSVIPTAAETDWLSAAAEYHLTNYVIPNWILPNAEDEVAPEDVSLSEPYDCYQIQEYLGNIWDAYTGASLEPLYDPSVHMKAFLVYHKDTPVSFFMLEEGEDEWWEMSGIIDYVDVSQVTTAMALIGETASEEKIAFIKDEVNIYLFTPELQNGYLIKVHGDVTDSELPDTAIFRTREVLIGMYEKCRDRPSPDEIWSSISKFQEEYPSGLPRLSLIPSRHYPVWPFWLIVVGIPVAVIALGVGVVWFIRKKRREKQS